jgi:hypothetical protein
VHRLAAALLLSCAARDAVSGPSAEPTFALTVAPDGVHLKTGPTGGATLPFSATATFDDGTVETDVAVGWSLSNRSVGSIDETGLFAPSNTNGGVTLVTAMLDDVVGEASLVVEWVSEVNPEGVDTSLFDATATPTTGLWLYPADGVNFPRNTPSIEFQWADNGGRPARLRFTSEWTDVSVYTTGRTWLADTATWQLVTSSNAGGDVTAELTLVAYDGTLYTDSRTLSVNRLDAEGSIVYWSTTRQGLVSIPYGGAATELITAYTSGHCVGCHVVSSTDLVAFTWDGGNGSLGLRRLSDGVDIIPLGSGRTGNFHSFSPDGELLLSVAHGNVDLYDAPTGTWMSTVIGDGRATHVDWSPDGSRVAYTVSDEPHFDDWYLTTPSHIEVMDHLGGGTFGPPRTLVTPPTGWRAYYPAWSPDGDWLAFNLSTGDAYDDPDAEVWVVDADAARAPVRLDAANDVGALTNSWPRWGPLPDDDVLWLAFASRRSYGIYTAGTPQVWVAAFDPARAVAGTDPSWAAFWLPGQDIGTGNHIPFWTD